MTFTRWGRYYWRLARELSTKYTSALVFGFILGIVGSLSILRLAPYIQKTWFSRVLRIAIVGNFTPTNLPLSVQKQISFGLTSVAPDGSPQPALATSWEATDIGKRYVFHLQSTLTWHNGRQFEAKDVNYNIKDVTFSPVDTHTLEATLKEPYSPFPTLVAKPIFQAGLRGLGPYTVSTIRLKEENVIYLRLLPFTDAKLPAREYRFYKTEAQAVLAYKLGDVDMIEDLADPSSLSSWGKTNISPHIRYDRIVTLFLNLKDQKLEEKSFRQGLAYGVPDLDEERAYSPISKNSWGYTETVRHYSFDEGTAKKALKNSAVATSSANLTISTFFPYFDIAQKIAKSWSTLGINAGVNVVSEVSPDYQILLTAQSLPPDPDQYPFWHSTQENTNITHYVNVKIDKLLEDGRKERDPEARKKIYADFARRLVDDAPAVFLYYPKTYTVERQK